MNKSRTAILGIVCGLLCAGAVFAYTQSVQGEASAARADALARYGGEQLEVCIAKKDISPGEKIDAANTTTRLWVADLLPEEAVRSLGDVLGKQATSRILAGEPISKKRFEDRMSTLEVPEGLSALSVPAKDVQTVGGAVRQGMSVDVYAIGSTSTSLLAKKVLVLGTSVGSDEKRQNASISWVTLALKPESVQETIAASQNAELYFVLPGSTEKGES